jgi:COP9 signalosome complex subunit 5
MEHEHHSPPKDTHVTSGDVEMADPMPVSPTTRRPARPTGKAVDMLYQPSENPSNFKVRGWRENANYFTSVSFSTTSVMEMGIHAKSGDTLEVMGLLMGKIVGSTFHVLNVFPLPVEGTETRVNAQNQANEYIIKFLESQRASGVSDYCIGWYHSHPGYGCWLSGIDVGTQSINQQFQDPFLAVVIDPHETIKTDKVAVGGFRTYPEGHQGRSSAGNTQGSIPLEKVEDYGVHADRYYELHSSFFRTKSDEFTLEVIRSDRWADILSCGPGERAKKEDIVRQEISQLASKICHGIATRRAEKQSDGEARLAYKGEKMKCLVPRSSQISAMSFNDSMTEIVKDLLFL